MITMLTLSSCSTESEFRDIIFGAEYVTMGEVPRGKLKVSKNNAESSFCPNLIKSYSSDVSRVKNEDGSASNWSGLIDEAILKFMEEHKAIAIYKPRISFTTGEYRNKFCGSINGRVVRVIE